MIQLDKGFVLRKIGDDYIIVPVGKAAMNFNGMITVNETGAFLWELLIKGSDKESLLQNLLETYDVSKEEAEKDLNEFLDVLYKNHII